MTGFHEAFWVTGGTVAPVIAVADAVVFGKYLGRAEDWTRVRQTAIHGLRRDADRTRQILDSAKARTRTLGEEIAAVEAEVRGRIETESPPDRAWGEEVVGRLDAINGELADLRGVDRELTDLGVGLGERVTAVEQRSEALRKALPRAALTDVCTAVSWALCVACLGFALVSLADNSDFVPTFWPAAMLVAAMGLVVVAPITDASRLGRELDKEP